MPFFRKKPVVIEAFQVPDLDVPIDVDFRKFLQNSERQILRSSMGGYHIKTLEGEMRAQPGDWIICGTSGEYYPCKPDVFADVYESVLKAEN